MVFAYYILTTTIDIGRSWEVREGTDWNPYVRLIYPHPVYDASLHLTNREEVFKNLEPKPDRIGIFLLDNPTVLYEVWGNEFYTQCYNFVYKMLSEGAYMDEEDWSDFHAVRFNMCVED